MSVSLLIVRLVPTLAATSPSEHRAITEAASFANDLERDREMCVSSSLGQIAYPWISLRCPKGFANLTAAVLVDSDPTQFPVPVVPNTVTFTVLGVSATVAPLIRSQPA